MAFVKSHPLAAASIALAAIVATVAMGYVGGHLDQPGQTLTSASDDTFASLTAPSRADGAATDLVAGEGGGQLAIAFVKFRVSTLPGGVAPGGAQVRLTRAAAALPPLVEISEVPDAAWSERSLTAASAPRLGQVLDSVRPRVDADTITFDVTRAIRAAGSYAFAITAPPGYGLALFLAKEAGRGRYLGPQLWLSRHALLPTDTPDPSLSPSTSPSASDAAALSSSAPSAASPSGPVSESPAGSPTDSAAPGPLDQPSASPSDLTASTDPSADPSTPPDAASQSPTTTPSQLPSASAAPRPSTSPSGGPTDPPSSTATASSQPSASDSGSPSPSPSASGTPDCTVGPKLVPTCGVLWGAAAGAHTSAPAAQALLDFETKTQRTQSVFHVYHQGVKELFPTATEIDMASDPAKPRILFINWKPTGASWAAIGRGDPTTDRYLDRLANHLTEDFTVPFFFTVHHEPENEVDTRAGSGYTPADYRSMFRHVILRLRADGVTNLVSVMNYMAYPKWNTMPWFASLYPGSDVVDWIAWDAYAYSTPGYGYGDFAEMMNRTSTSRAWPGFYTWAAATFPDKPLMVAEWGVWHSVTNLGHPADVFTSAGQQIQLFPRVKALIYFDTPNAAGKNDQVDPTPSALHAYQKLGALPVFQVNLTTPTSTPTPTNTPTPATDPTLTIATRDPTEGRRNSALAGAR